MRTKLTWSYGRVFCAMGVLAMSQSINAAPLKCASGNVDVVQVQLTTDGKRPYDPATTGFAHITFYNAVLGRLVHLKPNLTVEPGLLSEAYWDFKNQQYILRIKEGLKFHNGRTVEAEDLDFSLVRFFLTKTRADQVAFLKNIAGLQSLDPGMKYRPWMVNGIKKVDGRTVAVSLRSPNPAFLYSLSEGWISLVPREELQDDLTTWRSFPIGAGPYKVDHAVGGTVRVCRIAGQKESPQVVEFVSNAKISADVVGFQPADFSQKSLTKIRGAGPIGFTGIFFNPGN